MGSKLRLACARLWPCACFFCLAVSAPAATFEELWPRVEEKRLWNEPVWRTLGHYHRTLWGPVASRIDDPAFFLHPRGKGNPRLELQATLRAFTDTNRVEAARSVGCRFPARRRWLLEQLDLPDAAFAEPDCPEYHQTLAILKPESVTAVYPSAYLNSPASMFGHLLLVIDREGRDRLLSKAVNYAAVVGDSFGPLYALKGIFGLYDGFFAVLPYYDKVEEYSAVNRRDIWEYPLRLDADEVDRLLRHVWELQGLRSRYFFFKENCAFNLLFAVDAARSQDDLTGGFRPSAIPMGLLRELTRSGLTGEAIYRPSKSTQLRHLAGLLDPEDVELARSIARAEAPATGENPLVLSLALEWAQYEYTERKITPELYRERIFPILSARSKMGKLDLPPIAPPPAPHLGHGAGRAYLYGGSDKAGDALYGLRLRAAYHAWLDVPTGYPPGSFITFLEADVRARDEGRRLELYEMTLFDIRSFSPRDALFQPLSWAADLKAVEDPTRPGHHRGELGFSSGFTWSLADRQQMSLLMHNVLVHDALLDENVAWEPGVRVAWLHEGDRLRLGLHGVSRFGAWGSAEVRHAAEAEARWALDRETSVGFRFSHRQENRQDVQERLLIFSRTF